MPESSEIANTSGIQDCVSCRVWAGVFHIGSAVFVGTQYKKQTHLFSKIFVAAFSVGKFAHTLVIT